MTTSAKFIISQNKLDRIFSLANSTWLNKQGHEFSPSNNFLLPRTLLFKKIEKNYKNQRIAKYIDDLKISQFISVQLTIVKLLKFYFVTKILFRCDFVCQKCYIQNNYDLQRIKDATEHYWNYGYFEGRHNSQKYVPAKTQFASLQNLYTYINSRDADFELGIQNFLFRNYFHEIK